MPTVGERRAMLAQLDPAARASEAAKGAAAAADRYAKACRDIQATYQRTLRKMAENLDEIPDGWEYHDHRKRDGMWWAYGKACSSHVLAERILA